MSTCSVTGNLHRWAYDSGGSMRVCRHCLARQEWDGEARAWVAVFEGRHTTTGHFSNREKITALLTEWKFVNRDALNSEQITDEILKETKP